LNPPGFLAAGTLAFATLLTVGANLVALAWFGMWMGLNSKNTNLATLKTILFVEVIPWFVVVFTSAWAFRSSCCRSSSSRPVVLDPDRVLVSDSHCGGDDRALLGQERVLSSLCTGKLNAELRHRSR